jgi:hypothetical protein
MKAVFLHLKKMFFNKPRIQMLEIVKMYFKISRSVENVKLSSRLSIINYQAYSNACE